MVDAVAETPPPPAKSGPSLKAVIIAAVLAASLAGVGVYFMVGKKSDGAETAEGKPAADHKGGEKHAKLPAVYLKLDPPFVSNFESRGAVRFLQVTVEVMTRDPATAELIKQHDPMIRNDLLMLFGGQSYESISTHEGKEQLRASALDVVRKVINGEGGEGKKVEQVYFTSFVMQ